MGSKIKLSIIIPTRNRADFLVKALESIAQQPAAPDVFEVIVIDNGSTDETKAVVKLFRRKIKNYRYIYDACPGLHVGRNRGLLESRGEVLGYLDDDVILFPNWINTVLKAFEDPEVMYLEGSIIPYDMSLISKDFRSKYEIRSGSFRFVYPISCFWENGVTENDVRVHRAPMGSFFGANSVYRKSVLLKCRGFHPDGMPNNLLMYRGDGETHVYKYIVKHKLKAVYYAQASVYHLIDMNRVNNAYIDYMFFRNGISDMYTCLRAEGVKGGMIWLGRICRNIIKARKISRYVQGQLYLLLYYLFYKRIRYWVHKENYF